MESGTRLGPYEILEQLGAGGMGEVYLAQDTRLGRKVAVKVLPAQFASDRERLARFEQEARAAAALNHPHIAVVHDIGHEGDTHYIVQEYLEGESLAETVARGALPGKKALALGEQIARALAVAHAAGIVHRDLKPANVFVTPDGSAKVLDFGLAKLTDAATATGGADASLSPTVMGTMAGVVMGTAGYMAPEQVNGEAVDRRADLFAFGCVLYEMVTGQRAFAGQSVPDTLARVLHSEPELIEAPASVAPAELDRILRKCLMKEAAARYQYADDLAVDLGSLATALKANKGDAGAMAGAGAAASTDPGVEGGVPRARALGLAAGVAVAAIVLTATAMWATRTPPPPSPLRTFTIPFPEQHPAAGVCCASNLAITPDESRLLFVAREGTGGAWNFYNYRFTTGETRQLEGLNGYNPTISPDGTEFAYVHLPLEAGRRQGEEARLVRVHFEGGAPFDLGAEGFGAPAWGTDNRIYVGYRRFGAREVARLPATGGELDSLVPNDLAEGVTIRRVVPVPDRGFMLLELVDGLEARIAALDLATMDLHELVAEGWDPRLTSTGHLLFHRAGVVHAVPLSDDGMQLLGSPVPVLQGVMVGVQGSAQFTVSDSGTLAWVPGVVAGGVSRRMLSVDGDGDSQLILPDVDAYFSPRLSPDGGRILFAIGSFRTREYNLWIHDLDLDSTSALTDDDGSSSGVWSPDGEWIYYSRATEDEPGDIWRLRADGAGRAEAVLELSGEQYPVSITADGRSLLYQEMGLGEERFTRTYWLLALEDGETTQLTEGARGMDGRLSPDGQLLAYQADDSGFQQVYVLDLASGGARHAVTPGRVAARAPVWTPDGTQLVFSGSTDESPNLYRLRIGRSATGALEISAPEAQPLVGSRNWQLEDIWPDGRLLATDSERSNAAVGDTDTIRVTLEWFQELVRLAPRR